MPQFRVRVLEEATIQRIIIVEAPDREQVEKQYEKGNYTVLRTTGIDIYDGYIGTIIEIAPESP